MKKNPRYYIIILGLIGFLRNVLEVLFKIKIHEKWWALDIDVIFTNIFFVIHFCFFGSLMFHILLKVFKEKIPYSKIFLFLFNLQFIHLLIPFIDKIGLILGTPFVFKILPFENNQFFLSWTFMTLGIIIAWLIAGFLTFRFLTKTYKLKFLKSIVIIILLFKFFYWPTYHFYHTFNTLFNLATNNYFGKDNVFGYGIYFMAVSFFGFFYYLNNARLSGKNN